MFIVKCYIVFFFFFLHIFIQTYIYSLPGKIENTVHNIKWQTYISDVWLYEYTRILSSNSLFNYSSLDFSFLSKMHSRYTVATFFRKG